MACRAAPSFHDGSGTTDFAVCARASAGRRGPNKIGTAANVESRPRRLTPEAGRIDLMSAVSLWQVLGISWPPPERRASPSRHDDVAQTRRRPDLDVANDPGLSGTIRKGS